MFKVGGYITNPITGKIVNYQLYQEFYCPYMRPAADMVGADAVSYFTWSSAPPYPGMSKRRKGANCFCVHTESIRTLEFS